MYTVQYYDLVLLGVIAPIAVAGIVGATTAMSTSVLVPVAGLLSIVVIGFGLFVVGPVDEVADLTEEVEGVSGGVEELQE